jgi:hypothetical protein
MSDKIHKGISMPDMQITVFPKAWKKRTVSPSKLAMWQPCDKKYFYKYVRPSEDE